MMAKLGAAALGILVLAAVAGAVCPDPACDCGSPAPCTLGFTTSLGVGTCGSVEANGTVGGKKLLLKNPPSGPSTNKLVFITKDAGVTAGDAGGTDDPQCTGAGGGGESSLVVKGSSYASIALPCENWSTNNSNSLYKYKDQSGATCKKVLVKDGLAKAICKGSQMSYDLGFAESSVELTLRLNEQRVFTRFGGTIVKDGSDDKTFLAKDAAATAGATLASLDCNKLYIGGGTAGAVPPSTVPDYGTTKYKVDSCSGKTMTLAATTSAETGSNLDCTSAGCRYGPPLPITNPIGAISTCVLNSVAQDATGTSQCDTGSLDIDIPLSALVHLTGDQLPKRCSGTTDPNDEGRKCAADPDCPGGMCVSDTTDVQPCPICNPATNRCNGGPNDGNPCTPGTLLAPGPTFPTSHDCPPPLGPFPAGTEIGALPVPYVLTTGAASKVSTDLENQARVFCGFCASPLTQNFKDLDPNAPDIPVPCTSNADCAGLVGCPGAGDPCTACRQRSAGAFGQSAARTVTETGATAGAIATGDTKPARLASVFCVPPTYSALIDGSADIPGPGAATLEGVLSLSNP
jgi:hypothetical protein